MLRVPALRKHIFCPSRKCSTFESSMATIPNFFHLSPLFRVPFYWGDFIDVWKYEGVSATLLLSLPRPFPKPAFLQGHGCGAHRGIHCSWEWFDLVHFLMDYFFILFVYTGRIFFLPCFVSGLTRVSLCSPVDTRHHPPFTWLSRPQWSNATEPDSRPVWPLFIELKL